MSDPQPPDSELIRRYRSDPDGRQGRDAASELLGRYRANVYGWCLRRIGDPDRAEDLAQECLLLAYRALPRFEPRARFSTWLFSIVRNRWISEWRSRRGGDLVDLDSVELASELPDPERAFETREATARLIDRLERTLDEEERRAVWLRVFEGVPVDRITELLGVKAASGARGLLQRARRKLAAAHRREEEET
jgi:RNA polymerase sigma-70 factor (ECF subfamily)